MPLLMLVVALVREWVLSLLIMQAVLEVNLDYSVVITTQVLVTVLMPKMLDLDAVEDVSCVFVRLTI